MEKGLGEGVRIIYGVRGNTVFILPTTSDFNSIIQKILFLLEFYLTVLIH